MKRAKREWGTKGRFDRGDVPRTKAPDGASCFYNLNFELGVPFARCVVYRSYFVWRLSEVVREGKWTHRESRRCHKPRLGANANPIGEEKKRPPSSSQAKKVPATQAKPSQA